MYGSVTNSNGGSPVTVGNVNWTVTGGGSTAKVGSTIVNVNGQFFYIVRVSFETRSAGGVNFSVSPNTLPLTGTATTFNRAATVQGTAATALPPATGSFSFSRTDRGRIERVNLSVPMVVDPDLDTDGDGVPDRAEIMAGTDPYDPNSVFEASTDIQPAPGGGLIIKWSSIAGKTYTIHRATDLGQAFEALATRLPATAPENEFTDSTATGPGPYFYSIEVSAE